MRVNCAPTVADRRARSGSTVASTRSNSPLRNTSAVGLPSSGGRRLPRLGSRYTRIVRFPLAVGTLTRSDAGHLTAPAGNTSDWYVPNFCLVRLSATRSDAAVDNVAGNLNLSISCLTMDFNSALPVTRPSSTRVSCAVAGLVDPLQCALEDVVDVGLGKETKADRAGHRAQECARSGPSRSNSFRRPPSPFERRSLAVASN